MVIDKERIGTKFQIDFSYTWPFDVGGLITWDCLAHSIPMVKVPHEVDGNYMTGTSLINKSVRHYWYTSRVIGRDDEILAFDDTNTDYYKVKVLRQKLDKAYDSAELREIKKYHMQL